MKRAYLFWHHLKTTFSGIHLVDKCLILFMSVLLLQSAYSLFFHDGVSADGGSIDVIVRTSSASIFGYFLSANFIREDSTSIRRVDRAEPPKSREAPTEKRSMRNQIGFSSATDSDDPTLAPARITPTQPASGADIASHLQIIAATGIGLFCLVTLLLLRNMAQWAPALSATPAIAATVGQFRDFVSGCVGFLIGCPTSKK